METLIVGGTGFLGGAIVSAALKAGHDVTILSRGQTKQHKLSGVTILNANRYGSLDTLKNQHFDFVFDTCAFIPDAVKNLLQALGSSIRRYVMISSISAYGDFSTPQLNELQPVPTAGNADYKTAKKCIAENNVGAFALGISYGPLKRASEIVATEILGEKSICLRVGLLVGAGDYTDRLTWWMRRIDQGGQIPVPAPKGRLVQIIDVRDVADFAIHAATNTLSGIYNLVSPPFPLSHLLQMAVEISGSNAKFNWLPERLIQEANVQYWSELPLIAPPQNKFRHFLNIDTTKAVQNGLKIRPMEQTLEPLLQWDRQRRKTPLKCGLPREKEQMLLHLDSR